MKLKIRKMHLGAFFHPTGHHVTSWLHPDAQADANVNIDHYVEIARTAERGKFDLIFLADSASVREAHVDALSRSAQYIANFEPLTLLSALAMATTRIGLVATASTSFNEPYHIARKFASLDHLSHGRAGWNIVTSTTDNEARNFGMETHFDHEDRYERAREFTRVVCSLWDSWEDDAFIRDRMSGVFFDPEKLHTLNHRGRYYSVRGPLNIPRPPQGYPVLVQAGASETGRRFAAEFAEVVFSAHLSLEEAQTYYADIKRLAVERGRDPDSIKVLPGFSPLVGHDDADADKKFEALQSLVHPLVAREYVAMALKADLSGYSLDEPLPDLPLPNGSHSSFQTTMALARRENLTIRQLGMRMAAARQRAFVKGSPQRIADHMESWFRNGAADGFNIMPPILPGSLNDFVELVIPELRKRGLVREEYEGSTLRDHLGLTRPPCQAVGKRSMAMKHGDDI